MPAQERSELIICRNKLSLNAYIIYYSAWFGIVLTFDNSGEFADKVTVLVDSYTGEILGGDMTR